MVSRFICLLILFFSIPTFAQGFNNQHFDDEWHYAVSFPMVWMPSINADIAYDVGDNIEVDIAFEEIMQKLNFGLMGAFVANKGDWGFALSSNYLRTRSEAVYEPSSILIPNHVAKSTLHMATSDFTIRYRLHPSIRVLTGVRHFWTKLTLDVTPVEEGQVFLEKELEVMHEHTFDWIVGAAFDHWFTPHWGISFTLDAALYGQNDLDNNIAGYGIYKTDSLNNIWFGFRRLRIGNGFENNSDQGQGSATFTEAGPVFGWTFTF